MEDGERAQQQQQKLCRMQAEPSQWHQANVHFPINAGWDN